MSGFSIADRVKETSTTTGTGTITLAGAVTGFRTFSSVIPLNDQTFYAIVHRTANEWEVGLGTRTGATTLTRDQVYSSSNSGSAVNFSAGTKDVFVTAPADKQFTPYQETYTLLPTPTEASSGNLYRTIASQGSSNYTSLRFSASNDGTNISSQAAIGGTASATSSQLTATAFSNTSGSTQSVNLQLETNNIYSSFGGNGYLLKTSAGSSGFSSVPNQAGTSCFVYIGYDTVPTFTDWFGGSTAPVFPGTVIVGNAATSPAFYRYNGSSWVTMGGGGVTQIIAGTGITITSTGPSGTGAVTINASGGGGGPNWATYQDNDMTSAPLSLATPSSTTSSPYSTYFFASSASPTGPWSYSGSAGGGVSNVYTTSSYPVTTPITGGPPFSGAATCYFPSWQNDTGATSTLPISTGTSLYSNFSSQLSVGAGWPVFGATRYGHYIAVIQGSYLGSFSANPGCTLVDEFYDMWNNYTYYFVDCDSGAVSNMSSGMPVGSFGGSSASYQAIFWYNY